MAILRSGDGKFYDVEDSVLEGKAISAEKVQSLPAPQASSGLIQIVLNTPPTSGGAPSVAAPAEGDVAGHHGHGGHGGGCWYNCWYNCWHNHHWHNHCW